MKRRRKILAEVDSFQESPDKAPSFTFPLRDRFLQEGVGVKLICTVDAKPTPKITWYKDGKEVRGGANVSLTYSLGICSLELQAATMEDAGRYSLRAENSKGEAETMCKVTVNEKIVIKPMALLNLHSSSSTSSSSYNNYSSSSSSSYNNFSSSSHSYSGAGGSSYISRSSRRTVRKSEIIS